jgi:uncharacterized protein YcbK (DUF882 family)
MPRWGVVAPNRKATEHFHFREMACRHCGRIPSVEVIQKTCEWLERVREALGGRVIHINSGARCTVHNKAIGGEVGSLHIKGLAADITVRDLTPYVVWNICNGLQEKGLVGGLGRYPGFNHIDRGPKRDWSG